MTHDLKALRGLEKRLAEAKGPSNELDWDIHEMFGDGATVAAVSRYTSSLDAAIALVERVLPDWHASIQGVNLAWSARLNPTAYGKVGDSFANHSSPALALCLALVRALISQGEQ